MSIAYIFPGQGAQQVGMGRDVCESSVAAQKVFDQAEKATGLPLKKLCFEGPEEELARTDICQPAIFTVSAALLASMGERLGSARMDTLRPTYLAGLSLGEYTALYAAGAIGFEDAVKLVARRGGLMQQAATAAPSGMVSVMGLDETRAHDLCLAAANGQVLTCANFNCPGQIVLSGSLEACKRAEAMAKDFGASAAVSLKVAGAFHSVLMAPAAAELAKAIQAVTFAQPRGKVIANVDALPYDDIRQAKDKLLDQLVSPVRWQQSMEHVLAQGVTTCYEIGPGRVLAGLMRRINRQTQVVSVNSREAIEKLAGT